MRSAGTRRRSRRSPPARLRNRDVRRPHPRRARAARPEIAASVGTLPAGSRYGIVQALRQALEAAVRWGHMTRNPAKLAGPNPQPKAEEIHPFTQAEIDLVAEELGPKYGPAVVFASETGMRPSEWLAIEWRDVDRTAGVVLVERTCAYGVTKSYGKTARSRRRVPLSTRALEALDATPRRLDVRLVFPGARGGVIDLKNFRRGQWSPALEAAGSRHGGSTTCATRSRRGRSTPGFRSSSCPLHGDERGDDRSHVWAPRAGRRGHGADEARRRLPTTFGA